MDNLNYDPNDAWGDADEPSPAGLGPADTPTTSPHPGVTASTRLEGDLNCIQCGYNLRGQEIGGACTECGAPVVHSLRTDQLSQANPAWLGMLKQGMTWMIAGVVASVVMMMVGFVIGFMTEMQNLNQQPAPGQNPFLQQTQQSTPLLIFGVVTTLIYAGVFGAAYYLLTQPEPGSDERHLSRSITRWTILPALGLGFVAAVIAVGNNIPTIIASQVIQLVNFALICVGVPASLIYLRKLALRVPDAGLAKQTTVVLWGLGSSFSVMFLAMVGMFGALFWMLGTMNASSSGGPPSGVMAVMGGMGLFMCLAVLGFLVFGIWWIVLVCLFRGRFAQSYNLAMQSR